jgi:hypothetical protein
LGEGSPIFVLEAEIVAREPDPLDAARGVLKQTVELSVFYLADVGTDVCWALVKNGCCIRGDLCPWVHVPMIGIRVVLEAEGSAADFASGLNDVGKGPIRRGKKGLGLGKGGDNGGGKSLGPLGKGGDAAARRGAPPPVRPMPNDNPSSYLMDSLKPSAEFPEVSVVNGANKAKDSKEGRSVRGRRGRAAQ